MINIKLCQKINNKNKNKSLSIILVRDEILVENVYKCKRERK